MIIVSIIIPAKNEETNIESCLKSILSIDYPREEYEVIVVDNGSTDATVSIAQSLGAVVHGKPGLKISALRNFGAKIAKGSILTFIDADCTVDPDWLQQAEKYFHRNDIVCFGSAPRIPDEPTWVQNTWYAVRRKKDEVVETAWLESMNMFIPQSIFEQVGGFNESLVTCEDVDLSYRLAMHGKILSDQRIKAVHHGEAENLREFFRKERWRGKSNYKGVRQHGFRIDELPSLVLPIYFVLMLLLFVVSLSMGKISYSCGVFVLWQFPVLAVAFVKMKDNFQVGEYSRLIVLYNIYYFAKAIAVF